VDAMNNLAIEDVPRTTPPSLFRPFLPISLLASCLLSPPPPGDNDTSPPGGNKLSVRGSAALPVSDLIERSLFVPPSESCGTAISGGAAVGGGKRKGHSTASDRVGGGGGAEPAGETLLSGAPEDGESYLKPQESEV
jgi:hypothetical protein